MGRGLIPGTIWKISYHNLFITYQIDLLQTFTFILQKRSLNGQIEKIILKRVAFVQLANIFVSSLASKIYQTWSICAMTLETVCKIYPRR
jgi:hypothetical protein